MSEIICLPNLHKVLMSHKYCAYKCYFLPCGENVGKENRKTLAECILRGFRVPGAGVAKWVLRQICEIKLKFTKY